MIDMRGYHARASNGFTCVNPLDQQGVLPLMGEMGLLWRHKSLRRSLPEGSTVYAVEPGWCLSHRETPFLSNRGCTAAAKEGLALFEKGHAFGHDAHLPWLPVEHGSKLPRCLSTEVKCLIAEGQSDYVHAIGVHGAPLFLDSIEEEHARSALLRSED